MRRLLLALAALAGLLGAPASAQSLTWRAAAIGGSSRTVGIWVVFGNSHNGGRANAKGTEPAWDNRVVEYTPTSTYVQKAGTGRYNFTQAAGGSTATAICAPTSGNNYCRRVISTNAQISRNYWFINTYAALHPELSQIIVIDRSAAGTGMCDLVWETPADVAITTSCDGTKPPRLLSLETDANAVYGTILAQGKLPVYIGAIYHNGEPDFENVAANPPTLAKRMDNMIAHFRANVTGFGNAPMIIGGGKTAAELAGDGSTVTFVTPEGQNVVCPASGSASYDTNYQAAMSGAARRNAYVAVLDPVNVDRYGTTTGVPFLPLVDDCVHEGYEANRDAAPMMIAALARAAANKNPHGPFDTLSYGNSTTLYGLWDFRTASNLDIFLGRALSRQNANALPNSRYEPLFWDWAWSRPTGTSTGRYYTVNDALGAAYSKVLWFRLDDLSVTQQLWSRVGGVTATQHRLWWDAATQKLKAANGTATQSLNATIASSAFSTSAYHFVAVTFDGTNGKLFFDDCTTPVSSNTMTAVTLTDGGYLGTGDSALTEPFFGRMGAAMQAKRALTSSELCEFYTAAQATLHP